MRGPAIALAEAAEALGARLLPQTEQRVALIPSRVPQVGQIFVVLGVFSGVIIPLTKYRGGPRFDWDYTIGKEMVIGNQKSQYRAFNPCLQSQSDMLF